MIVMLEGLIETSYTKADNASVVATDTSTYHPGTQLTNSEEHSLRLLQDLTLRSRSTRIRLGPGNAFRKQIRTYQQGVYRYHLS